MENFEKNYYPFIEKVNFYIDSFHDLLLYNIFFIFQILNIHNNFFDKELNQNVIN